jgi:hypothetical protein
VPSRLRRLIRPLRPILLPIRGALRRAIAGLHPFVEVTPASGGGKPINWAVARRITPIRPIRHEEWERFAADLPYCRGRWGYTDVAGRIAAELIARDHLRTALELGPWRRPLIVGADIMDAVAHPDVECEGRIIIHSGAEVPWPVADNAYDLFVALQVFEHLGTGQREAFREVRRVARHAIISLPIDWVMEDPTNIHHGITHEQVLGWFEPVTPTRVEVGTPGAKKRLVYVFEDLPAPEGH